MSHEGPSLSIRHDAVGTMAGAIFMSNTFTREQCFQASIFGLPLEYQSFVSHVTKGMPLFLFDHTLRKLYGVFEASSDGGLNINNASFRSSQRSYPAQVRINIIWKCRPLTEDEFFPAIEENYYQPRKFYLDLSYKQVVRLYELFDNKRVERPVHDYPQNKCLETDCSSKGVPDKESLTPDPLRSNNQPRLLVPNISEVVRRYSTPKSMHTDLPLSVEAHPKMLMPLGTEINGAQIVPTYSYHDQREPFSQSEFYPAASMADAASTQVSAPCSQTPRQYQLVAKQSHPLPVNYPQNILPAGCTAQDPTKGSKSVANQSYPLYHGNLHNDLLISGCATQNPTYKGRSHLDSTFPSFDHLYPCLPLLNPQSNSDYQVQCDICFNQGRSGAHSDIYAYERQCLREREALTREKLNQQALTREKLNQQGIPTFPEVIECDRKTVSAIDHQKKTSTDFIQIPDCGEDFRNDQMRHGTHTDASDSTDHENDIVDPRHTQHGKGAENKTKGQYSPSTKSVFSRLSAGNQLTSQEATDPTLNQLIYSLSQKTEQWSHRNRQIEDSFVIPLIREQDVNYSHVELNLPSQLELEEDVSIEPQLPLLNFKRRSEAGKVDANLGKEISGKVKRRKLVRPSFGENNASINVGNELKGNHSQDKNQNHQGSENHFGIDLNVPAAPVDSDAVDDNRLTVCPSVGIKAQTEKPHEIDANKPNSDVIETTKEHDPSGAPAQKVSNDFDLANLNTMDESKLRTIFTQTSSLLQALAKLKNEESNRSEKTGSNICAEDRKVNMALNSDEGHQT